jgi:hypothetical protein
MEAGAMMNFACCNGKRVVLLGLLVAIAILAVAMKKQDHQLAVLKERVLALQANDPTSVTIQPRTDELERLRRETDDLPKLRNLAYQLRQSPELEPSREFKIEQLIDQNKQLRSQNEDLRKVSARSECMQNLRKIGEAKQRWAAAHEDQPPRVLLEELMDYLPEKAIPNCPGGGHYSVNRLCSAPSCSVAGHSIP